MTNRKLTGSYYTPKAVADFLVSYLSKKVRRDKISILEPSAGDGIFIKSIYNHKTLSSRIKKVVAVEQDGDELEKVRNITKSKSLKTIHSDFLEFQKDNNNKFNLVVGNPPYIKKSLLTEEQIQYCSDIHALFPELSKNKIKNIWTSFLIRCISFVSDDGILAFVLPSEFLQVKFAAELRTLMLKEFERIEIFTFNELLFEDCKGQDTLLLICQKKSRNKGFYFSNIKKAEDLKNNEFNLSQNTNITESKWNHQLSTDEYELLSKIKNQLSTINHYCSSKPGVVTAANDFFIVDKNVVEEYSLNDFIKPIIQKGLFVNGSVELNKKEFNALVNDYKPTYLLAFNQNSNFENNAKVLEYIKLGEDKNLMDRYKMTKRKKWFEVPNVGTAPQAFFFKRCDEYPKLIKNNAQVLSTDSAYTITMNEGYEVENLIFSFYNSLSLSFAELDGRYYGGGVLELTPNEFKNLPTPYIKVKRDEFDLFVHDFKSKSSIKEICKRNDAMILKQIDKSIDADVINALSNIREKLYLHRIKA